ncbi:protein OBERON 3-like [Macadamia integrifolia]|uniref:protein OBERON 3-like n=1 Tax=Macadamia integrifolia TaxID=60698 RepID=UPI001C528C79|nr:protein OBERON 3-like [Macadamia integrifolia]
MFSDIDLSNGFVPSNDFVPGTEGSTTKKLKPHLSKQNLENPDGKNGFSDKGSDLLRDSDVGLDGFRSKASYSRIGNLGSQELTLSYLCDNPKMVFQEKEISGKNLLSVLEKDRYKGKEVISENTKEEERWVERDFLQLNGVRAAGTKRELDQEIEREKTDKKAKLETLNLSLALPDVSLSLNSSPNADSFALPKPTRSIQSLAPSNNNTRTASSDDFTAASLSYSYSVPFSHNPSCSLFTRNSTENCEYSFGSHQKDTDQIWCCGEGTNGSVHSRFRPVGDGVVLANHGGGGGIGGGFGHQLMQSNRQINKDPCSLHRTASSDNQSFFPSELPARPKKEDTALMDSRGRASRKNSDGNRARKGTRPPKRILLEIVSDSIPVMAGMIQDLPDETIESAKEHLRNLIGSPEKREELADLQNRLKRRSDLTSETLSKSHRDQLEILVAIKTELVNYISGKNRIPMPELVEIFMLMRCRNVNCKGSLPVDDCDCKICSAKKGFCSACMCPVCLNFDCASNTCSWVGCDACSHWCHASCGIQRNLIRPGPNLKGSAGTSEMQFYCLGCDHASEMFGFVKDVFIHCAKDWGLETLKKELDCVKKIFRGSESFKDKELQRRAEEALLKLENNIISPSVACDSILQFFKYGASAIPGSGASSKDLTMAQICQKGDVVSLSTNSPPSKSTTYNMSSSSGRQDRLPNDVNQNILMGALTRERRVDDELESVLKKDGFDSLESIVRIKEAEARMFQSHADDAQREAEGYRRMVRIKSEKLEEEYASNIAKLCLQETEERRRKKLEELKILENSHCDYYKMKFRMQAQIAGLLERMESTKKQWGVNI